MKHTDEAKRKIGDASRVRGSAAIALKARWENRQTVCGVDGCDKAHEAKGLCNMHYLRLRKTGSVGGPESTAPGVHISAYGYRFVNSKAEHVAVAEKSLGKPLPPGAVVHHVNEDKLDNRNSNLVICPDRAYHNALHAKMRAQSAGT